MDIIFIISYFYEKKVSATFIHVVKIINIVESFHHMLFKITYAKWLGFSARQANMGSSRYFIQNATYPEFLYSTNCGVMCLDFHPDIHNYIVVGMYDGNVAVYNVKRFVNIKSVAFLQLE